MLEVPGLETDRLVVYLAILNSLVIVAASVLFSVLYVKSVQPARLAQQIGPAAYTRCRTYRLLAGAFEGLVVVTYVLYVFVPLPLPIPGKLPWPYVVSLLIALAIGVPSLWIMVRGIMDAGEETLAPRPEHPMYGGIYRRLRHPQALGEVFLWWVIAFLLNSPFLVLYSVIWFPLFYRFCLEEEKDLILRYGDDYRRYQSEVGMFFPR